MKAFLVGLVFLMAVLVFAGIGILLYPLLFVLAFVLRVILSLVLIVAAIWALGKFIMYIGAKIFR